MSKPLFRFLLLLLLLSSAGCAARKTVVKITCSWRGSARRADELIAGPMQRKLMLSAEVEKITSISTKHKVEIYVTGRSGFRPSDLLDSVKRGVESSRTDLPPNASIAGITLLAAEETIPVLQPQMVNSLSILVDEKKSARLGVAFHDIDTALSSSDDDEPASGESAKKVASLVLPAVDGKQVLLGDIATVTVVKIPDVVVRTFP